MYVIAFVDRTNIGFAEESLEVHAGLSTGAYALGAGLFFVGYAVFEVPSNLIMHRVGARWWMARIMVSWGVVAALFMFTTGPTMFYVLRFLLGVAEAGFFPGVILYLTYWFPRRRRAQATALFYMGLPVANILGGPLSGALMDLDGALGMWGFQWLFLVEGLLAVLVGIIAFFYLADRPSDARWLTQRERSELQSTLDAESAQKEDSHKLSWWRALLNGRILYFCLIYFTIQVSVYGLTFFLPQQIADISGRDVGLVVGLLFAIPWVLGLGANLVTGRLADRSGNYRGIAIVLLAVSGAGLLLTGLVNSAVLVMVGLCLAAIGFCSAQPIFWNIPTSYLSGAALASSIGLINGVGNLGGFVAPNLRVWTVETFGAETAGLLMLASMPILGAILLFGTRMFDAGRASTAPSQS
ncbi:MFS transporter [Brachybacterium endophyticum]|uniref:MFS transporter n=2 Tax=Brachybacterium endophyticum TaxID=2182385 RepID=A0A2U2RPU6_9MICO|nr:MFS transporter [Brachybacterium endophyticum]